MAHAGRSVHLEPCTTVIASDINHGKTVIAAACELDVRPNACKNVSLMDPTAKCDIEADEAVSTEPGHDKLSKNQLKKLKRKQIWDEQREDRKRKRKEKRHQRSDRRRELIESACSEGIDPRTILPPRKRPKLAAQVPITFILDCDFEQYMLPDELVSLAGQLVRCYADNRRSTFQSHLFFSSFGGKLKERFETLLQSQHEKWVGAHFVAGDYRAAATEAENVMRGPHGGELTDLLKATTSINDVAGGYMAADAKPGARSIEGSVVYLTSDSPNVLTALEPYTSYVIGGVVDRNREKGLCFQRAQNHGVRTAKLPIGEYMALSTRHVLTTNQVVDIMLKWMESGDWGSAFMRAIPPRKGGRLKAVESEATVAGEHDAETQANRSPCVDRESRDESTIADDTICG